MVGPSLDATYRELAEPAARMYRLLGAHPGSDFTIDLAAALGKVPVADARRLVGELSRVGLVRERGGAYVLQARMDAYKRAGVEEREQAQRRGVEWHLTAAAAADLCIMESRWHVAEVFDRVEPGPYASPREALDWLEPQLANMAAVLRLAAVNGWLDQAWQMCDALWGVLLMRRPYELWVEVHDVGIAAARGAGHPVAEAKLMLQQGAALLDLGRLDEARENFEKAHDLTREAGHRLGEASALHHLGVVALAVGGTEQAERHLRGALGIHLELGRPRGAALMRRYLGETHLQAGRYGAALEELGAALKGFRGLSPAEPYNVGRATTYMGHAMLGAGKVGEAVSLLREALQVMEELGADKRVAEVLAGLAEAELRRGNRAEGLRYLTGAAERYSGLGDPEAEAVQARLEELRHQDAG